MAANQVIVNETNNTVTVLDGPQGATGPMPGGAVSSSAQIIPLLPTGTVSSSLQINTGSFSGSITSASFATSATSLTR